jgi:hypothetical protein
MVREQTFQMFHTFRIEFSQNSVYEKSVENQIFAREMAIYCSRFMIDVGAGLEVILISITIKCSID